MLNRALRMAFWVMYDHLGNLLIANVLWSIALLVPGFLAIASVTTGDPRIALAIGAPLGALTLGVLAPAASVGLAQLAKALIDTGDGTLSEMFAGIRDYWRRAAVIGVFYVVGGSCLFVSSWFYAAQLRDTAPWLGYGLSALAAWGLVFLGLMAMLVFPALVQRKVSAFRTLKLTALLVLDNPLFCLGLAVQFAVLAAASLMPPVFLFLSGSLGMTLSSSAYEMLARKYAAVRMSRTGEAPARPIHVVSRQGKLVFDDSEDDLLNRGFRDFLFPWKG